jgi:hypothetical protein
MLTNLNEETGLLPHFFFFSNETQYILDKCSITELHPQAVPFLKWIYCDLSDKVDLTIL